MADSRGEEAPRPAATDTFPRPTDGQAEQGIKMACAERRYRCDAARGDAAASTRRSPRRRLAFAHNRPLPAFGTSDEGHVANVSAALPKGGDAGIAAQLLAGALWSRGITGAGVRVAVLDSGVVPAHPDFKAGVSSTDWTDEPGGGGEERDWGAASPCCALRKHKDTKRSRRVSSYDVLQLEQVFASRSVRDTCAHSQTAAASPARPHACRYYAGPVGHVGLIGRVVAASCLLKRFKTSRLRRKHTLLCSAQPVSRVLAQSSSRGRGCRLPAATARSC